MGYIYSDPAASFSDRIGSADYSGYIYSDPNPYMSGAGSSSCIG